MLRSTILVAPLFIGSLVVGQDYVGQESCSGCHRNQPYQGFYDGYIQSGHPWKLFRTAGEVPPPDTWPWSPVPPLPEAFGEQLEWSDVEYVIGNFYWKARYIDRDGFIWTGDADDRTQWNLATEGFVPYHPGEERPFNCGRCHTTGYEPDGNQHGLPGLIGTWAAPGVQCEACHGPSSVHVASGGQTPPPGGKACSDCHYRDADFRMPWKGGFMRHHQQSEDLSHSPHSFFSCTTCHNPHRSVVYNEGGTIKHCTDCHDGDTDNGFYRVQGMRAVDCSECHMPHMGKSAVKFNDYTGDIRGHLFSLMTEPIAAADNTYEADGQTFWNQDEMGRAFVTLDYACLGCHTDEFTLEAAAAFAIDIHTEHLSPPGDADDDGRVDFFDLLLVLRAWGACDESPPDECTGDVNFDGAVDGEDLRVVATNWG